MNKKFFTLLVALFAMISFGAFAQVTVTDVPGTETKYNASNFYLLQTQAGNYLAVDTETNGLITVTKSQLTSYASLQAALWTVSASGGTGTVPATYTYKNAANDVVLALPSDKAITAEDYGNSKFKTNANILGGDITPWVASTNSVKPGTNFFYVTGKDDAVTTMAAVVEAAGTIVVPVTYENLTDLRDAAEAAAGVNLGTLQAAVTAAQKVVDDMRTVFIAWPATLSAINGMTVADIATGNLALTNLKIQVAELPSTTPTEVAAAKNALNALTAVSESLESIATPIQTAKTITSLIDVDAAIADDHDSHSDALAAELGAVKGVYDTFVALVNAMTTETPETIADAVAGLTDFNTTYSSNKDAIAAVYPSLTAFIDQLVATVTPLDYSASLEAAIAELQEDAAAISLTDANVAATGALATAEAALAAASAGKDAVIVITPKYAGGEIPLSANDLNTHLGKTGDYDGYNGFVANKNSRFTLTITPTNTQANPFTGNLQAHAFNVVDDEIVLVTNSFKNKTNGWVVLSTDTKNEQFIVVDTAVIAGTDQDKNGLIETKTDRLYGYTTKTIDTRKRLIDSYIFQFVYDAKTNGVQIKSAGYIAKPNAAKLWTKEGATLSSDLTFTYAKLLSEVAYTFGTTMDSKMGIYLLASANYQSYQIPQGVYLLKNISKRSVNNGKYARYSLAGNFEWIDEAPRQNFQHMPATQWVITSTSTHAATIVNREFAYQFAEWDNVKYTPGKISYKAGDKQFFFLGGDTVQLVDVKDTKSAKLGYRFIDKKKELAADVSRYQFRYLHDLSLNNPVAMKNADFASLFVNKEDAPQNFRMREIIVDTYGYNGNLKDVTMLERSVYRVEAKDPYSETGATSYMAYDYNNKKYFMSKKPHEASYFFLKENNEIEGEEGKDPTCYYVFIEANYVPGDWAILDDKGKISELFVNGFILDFADFRFAEDRNDWPVVLPVEQDDDDEWVLVENGVAYDYTYDYRWGYADSKVSVDNNTLELVNGNLDDTSWNEVANSAFKVEPDTNVLYRTIGHEATEEYDEQLIKIFRKNSDTSVANREYLYEDANSVYSTPPNAKDGERLNIKDQINFLGVEGKGDYKNTAMLARYVRGTVMPQYLLMLDYKRNAGSESKCPICEEQGFITPGCPHHDSEDGFSTARVLVSLKDSVASASVKDKNIFKWNNMTRLAFVYAKLTDGKDKAGKLVEDSVLTILSSNIAKTEMNKSNAYAVRFDADEAEKDGKHYPVMFALRFIGKETNDFMIESDGAVGGDKNTYVKVQNGVPVLVETDFYSAVAREAEIFNLETTDETPTSNKGIDAAQVDVVAGQGYVTIKGAAGQQVVVANILGQVITNVVLDSNEATIAAPAGVVVVSVNGAATKALVK